MRDWTVTVASRGGIAGGLAFGGVLLAAAGAVLAQSRAAQPLLSAFIYWGGMPVGALALLIVHRITGGAWGESLSRPLRSAAGALPLSAVLTVLLLLSLGALYPWAGHGLRDTGPPHWYLSRGFFALRTLAYLGVWLALAWTLGVFKGASRLRGQAAAGGALVLFVVVATLAAFDWLMSLDPEWYSAEFGLLVGMGQVTAALALAVLWLTLSGGREPEQLADAGNLLLACVLLWSYLLLMQFLTIWIADLPREIRWFVPRMQTGWRWLALPIAILHLLVPLPLLFSPRTKRQRATLAAAAASVLCGQALYALWLVLPTLRPRAVDFGFSDAAVFIGVGGLWLALFLWRSAGAAAPYSLPEQESTDERARA